MKSLDSASQTVDQWSLLCIECDSIGAGYRALSDLTSALQKNAAAYTFRVLEAAPLGAGFVFFISGEATGLSAVLPMIKDLSTDHALIATPDLGLHDALFALAEVPLQESLLVVECASVSATLTFVDQALKQKRLGAIEIRLKRALGGVYAYLTGSQKDCALLAQEARHGLAAQTRDVKVQVIDQPSSEVRRLFSFSGSTTDIR